MSAAVFLERELRRLDRQGGWRRVLRVLAVLVLALPLLFAHGSGPRMPFLSLVGVLCFVLCAQQPVRAAGILAQGRADGTLPLLALTPLSSWAILLGAGGAALSFAVETLLLALPLVAVTAAYGGLEPALVARALGTLLALSVLGTAVGLLEGARGDHAPGAAFRRALGSMFFVLLAPLVADGVASALGWTNVSAVASLLFFPAAFAMSRDDALLSHGLCLALSAGLVAVATRRLRRTVLGDAGRGATTQATTRRAVAVPTRWVVAWRERHRPDPRRLVRPGFLVGVLVVSFWLLPASQFIRTGDVAGALRAISVAWATLWVLALVWGLMTGARAYAEDREAGLHDALLVTTLSPRRIAWEKLLGATSRGLRGLLAGWLVHAATTAGAILLAASGPLTRPLEACALASGELLARWMLAPLLAVALGQWFSLVAGTAARAQAWAATTSAIVLFAGLWLTCVLSSLLGLATSQGGLAYAEHLFLVACWVACLLAAVVITSRIGWRLART